MLIASSTMSSAVPQTDTFPFGGMTMEPVPSSPHGDHKAAGNSPSRRLFRLAGILALLLIGGAAYALTQGGNETPLNPIAQAAVRTQQSPGARTSFHATVRGQSLPHPIKMSGRGLFNGTTNRSQLKIVIPARSGRTEMVGVTDGGHIYLKSELMKSALPEGDEWMGMDMSLGSSSETGAIASASPMGQLAALRAASGKVEKLGEKRIRGVGTTGYRSLLDPAHYAEYLRGKGSMKAAEEYEQLAKSVPSTTQVETWIDRKGLVRQTLVKGVAHDPSGNEITTVMTVDFYDYGISPEIQLPDPGAVYDATPMIRSELGLDGSS